MVPFGLAQAPTYFQALITKVLKGLHKFAMAYLDGIIIFSKEHLKIIFQWQQAAGLKLKRSKCDFMRRHIQYLGHLISPEAIQPFPAPKSTKEVKQFLGLAGYYRKFVPRFSDISRPLTSLTHKDVMFEWTKECQALFLMLKGALCQQPILRYPNMSKPYVLFTDVSNNGWTGVLNKPYEEID